MTATSRLLALLSLLQTRRDWPGALLAERLEISQRTVRRDVDRLRELGYRIQATRGPDGGYRLDAGSELPPLLFDDDQVVALAVGLRTAATAGAGVEEAAVRALTTVRQVMPARLRHRLDALTFTNMTGAAAVTVSPDVVLALSEAVRASTVVRMDYAGRHPDQDLAPRAVEPHHLVAADGRWYLVGWDRDRDDWRVFRADRITLRTPGGPRFAPREVPGGDVAAYLTARFRGSDLTRADWPCVGTVVIALPAADVLPFAVEGTVEDLGGQRCVLRSGSWSWPALAAALSRFDADVEVVGPRQLVEAFALLAQRSARTAARGLADT